VTQLLHDSGKEVNGGSAGEGEVGKTARKRPGERNLEVDVCSELKTWPDLVAEPPEHGEAEDGAGTMCDVRVLKLVTDEVSDDVRNTY